MLLSLVLLVLGNEGIVGLTVTKGEKLGESPIVLAPMVVVVAKTHT